MIIVDTALKRRAAAGDPIKVGLIGAGYMGSILARQIATGVTGMDVAGIANRTIDRAIGAIEDAGIGSPSTVETPSEAAELVRRGQPFVTEDPDCLCRTEGVDVIIECTGDVEYASQVALAAIDNGKHVVLMNAELDATIGPILKVHADRAGVVITNVDGDEPGVAMNLFRFVDSIGYQPVMTGNIKGFYDPYRNPETQEGFAQATGQGARMVTSFADGTKLSMEACIVANATGFKVAKRGMHGHRCGHVKEVTEFFDADELRKTGYVDFVLGAEPGTGAFVVGYNDDPVKAEYMRYFKMGDGPLYVFYTPFHLPQLEAPLTAARAVLFADAAVTPLGGPSCDVVTIAKRDLKAGEALDGIGGFTCFGMIENYEASRKSNLLPMGLSDGCRLRRDVARDVPIKNSDVDVPAGRVADKLRAEQDELFLI